MSEAQPQESTRKRARTSSSRAQLRLSVGRMARRMKKRAAENNLRLSKKAAVFLTGVLEEQAKVILRAAGKVAQDDHKLRVLPRHIIRAKREEPNVGLLLGGASALLSHGGTDPAGADDGDGQLVPKELLDTVKKLAARKKKAEKKRKESKKKKKSKKESSESETEDDESSDEVSESSDDADSSDE